jgi:hypothetical protein
LRYVCTTKQAIAQTELGSHFLSAPSGLHSSSGDPDGLLARDLTSSPFITSPFASAVLQILLSLILGSYRYQLEVYSSEFISHYVVWLLRRLVGKAATRFLPSLAGSRSGLFSSSRWLLSNRQCM